MIVEMVLIEVMMFQTTLLMLVEVMTIQIKKLMVIEVMMVLVVDEVMKVDRVDGD